MKTMKKNKNEIIWKNKSGIAIATYVIRFKNIYSSKDVSKEELNEFKVWLINNDYPVVSII